VDGAKTMPPVTPECLPGSAGRRVRVRVRLGEGVPDLASLGARAAEDLLERGGAVEGFERAELLRERRGEAIWRVPLPGTPVPDGRRHGRPRGAGTGHLLLHRWWPSTATFGRLLAARVTSPASASLAEREWNVICRVRAAGVGTPEPLAVGAAGDGPVSRRCFLVVRALEGHQTLPAWLEQLDAGQAGAGRRARGLEAAGAALGRAFRSGVRLPALGPANVWIRTGGCEGGAGPVEGLEVRRLPAVALTGYDGAGVGGAPGERGLRARLRAFAREAARVPGMDAEGLRLLVDAALGARAASGDASQDARSL
jgi:hypothetical protein